MATSQNRQSLDEPVEVGALRFDTENPRIPTETFNTEDEVIRYLIDEYDVEELVQSILSSGWIDFEPLVAQRETNIVYEGNRRLAALRLIVDADLRARMNYRLPIVAAPKTPPREIRVRYVKSRADARQFIAFKHINGPFKWDAYAKAKYAVNWLNDGEDIDTVSKMLGDNHNTVRRLVAGYQVLTQAQESRLFDLNDRTKKRFAFSHLYTAISRPGVRSYLGIEEGERELSPMPVPKERVENLKRLCLGCMDKNQKENPL